MADETEKLSKELQRLSDQLNVSPAEIAEKKEKKEEGKKRKDPPAPIEYPTVTIKFNDLFNFKELYLTMYAWLKNEGWKDKSTGSDVEYMEEFYLEKIGPTGAKDHIIYWDVEKIASDYFKYTLNIVITTAFLNQTEVMVNAKKVTANAGEVKIVITAKLFPDYTGDLVNHWLLGSFPFYKYMINVVMKNDYSAHKAKIYKQLYGFQAEIKRYLKLKQSISPQFMSGQYMSGKEEGFNPEKQV